MRSDIELKRLAVDTVEGLVFTDRHLTGLQQLNGSIALVFLGVWSHFDTNEPENVNMVYEYLDKASKTNKTDDDLPVFTSYSILSESETKKLSEFIENYEQMKAGYGTDSDDD